MNLYFRLLCVLIKSMFCKATHDLLDVHHYTFRVWPLDLSIDGFMNNGRYFGLLDVAGMDFMMRCGFLVRIMRRHIKALVRSNALKYLSSLRLFEVGRIETRLVGWSKHWVYFEYRLYCKDRQVAAGYRKVGFIQHGYKLMMEEFLEEAGVMVKESPSLPEDLRQCLENGIL